MHLVGLLRQVTLRDILAVAGLAVLETHNLNRLAVGLFRARGLERLNQARMLRSRTKDAVTRSAGGRNLGNKAPAP